MLACECSLCTGGKEDVANAGRPVDIGGACPFVKIHIAAAQYGNAVYPGSRFNNKNGIAQVQLVNGGALLDLNFPAIDNRVVCFASTVYLYYAAGDAGVVGDSSVPYCDPGSFDICRVGCSPGHDMHLRIVTNRAFIIIRPEIMEISILIGVAMDFLEVHDFCIGNQIAITSVINAGVLACECNFRA